MEITIHHYDDSLLEEDVAIFHIWLQSKIAILYKNMKTVEIIVLVEDTV